MYAGVAAGDWAWAATAARGLGGDGDDVQQQLAHQLPVQHNKLTTANIPTTSEHPGWLPLQSSPYVGGTKHKVVFALYRVVGEGVGLRAGDK